MTTLMYLKCFSVALIGCALQAALKIKSIQTKARQANVQFKPSQYFVEDWISLSASFLTIILFLFFIDGFLKWKPEIMDYLLILMSFVGYTGSDIASRLFSVVNDRINNTIGSKTTIADTQTGNLDSPTPVDKKQAK